jgi:hypothetical protein
VEAVADVITGLSGGGFATPDNRGKFNQPRRLLHDTGAVVYFGSSREDQPVVIECSGEVCERVSEDDLISWAMNLDAGPSRVDLAADVEPARLAEGRVSHMLEAFERGECETRIPATSGRVYRDLDPAGGTTAYFGSTKSDLIIRAYNSRGPLRVELEWKPDKLIRGQVVPALARYGAGGMWRNLARRCIWPMEWYGDLLAGDVAELEKPTVQASALQSAVEALVLQHGANLWAFRQLGFDLNDLARAPRCLTSHQHHRFRRWADEADNQGIMSTTLRTKLEALCRV